MTGPARRIALPILALVLTSTVAMGQPQPWIGTDCWRVRVMPLSQIPPDRPDMPPTCKAGYTLVDSLVRGVSSFQDFRLSGPERSRLAECVDAMRTYDPLLLEEYRWRGKGNAAERLQPNDVIELVESGIGRGASASTKRMLAASPLIVHLRILRRPIEQEPRAPESIDNGLCVDARILEVVKGGQIAGLSLDDSIFRFVYFPDRSTLYLPGADVTVQSPNYRHTFDSTDEFIGFFKGITSANDSRQTFFAYTPLSGFEPSGGPLPVRGGMVYEKMPGGDTVLGSASALPDFVTRARRELLMLYSH